MCRFGSTVPSFWNPQHHTIGCSALPSTPPHYLRAGMTRSEGVGLFSGQTHQLATICRNDLQIAHVFSQLSLLRSCHGHDQQQKLQHLDVLGAMSQLQSSYLLLLVAPGRQDRCWNFQINELALLKSEEKPLRKRMMKLAFLQISPRNSISEAGTSLVGNFLRVQPSHCLLAQTVSDHHQTSTAMYSVPSSFYRCFHCSFTSWFL